MWNEVARIGAIAVLALPGPSEPAAWDGEQLVNDWLMTGIGAPDYALTAEGESVRVEKTVASTQRFVAVVRVVPADDRVGKRVKASFDVRTDGIEGGACVIKVQRTKDLQYAGFLAAEVVDPPAGSEKGFVRCDISIAVPNGAKWILYGYTYRGPGKGWLRKPNLE